MADGAGAVPFASTDTGGPFDAVADAVATRAGVGPDERSAWSDFVLDRAVLAVLVVSLALLVVAAGGGFAAVAVVVAFVPATAAAMTDRREARLPDPLLIATACPAVAWSAVGAVRVGSGPVVAVLAGAAAMALPVAALHLMSPRAMGFGDVKLAAALGAVLGTVDWRLGIVALMLASAATSTVGLASRRTALAFGPGLVAGAALAATTGLITGAVAWR